MPMREIEKIYTKSELFIIGWRSQETASNMEKRMKRGSAPRTDIPHLPDVIEKFKGELSEPGLEPMKVDMDLRKMTGAQLQRYFGGLALPKIATPRKD